MRRTGLQGLMSKLRLLLLFLPTLMHRLERFPVRLMAWLGLGVLALGVTMLAGLAALVVDLVADWIGRGSLREAADTAARLPIPDWMAVWVDPAWIRALQSLVQQLLHLSGDALPVLAQGIGLIQWLIWGLWGLVMLALVFAGLKVHLLVGESQRAVTRQIAPSARSVNR